MIKFVRSLLLFVLPVVLFMFFAEILLRHIPNQYSYKAHYLEKYGNEIETLILGSSHSYYGIDPNEFSSKTFNAASTSQTLDLDYAILQKYSDRLVNLKTVIVLISYFSLFGKMEFGIENWRLKDYHIYYDLNVPIPFKDGFEILLKGSNKKIENYFFGENDLGLTELGQGTLFGKNPQNNLEESGKIAAKRHTAEKDTAQMLFPEMQRYLESIIEICQKKNCQIILITMPAWHSYIENMDIWQWQKTQETVLELEKRYRNVRYFNFMADTQFVASDFGDADHLNPQGAKKLSRILDTIINGQNKNSTEFEND